MELINKAAVVAEIENLLDKGRYHEEYDCAYRDGNNGALYALKDKLNNLEVKEVSLEDLKEELDKAVEIYKPDGDFGWGTLYNIAVHFFELGLKTKNRDNE